MPLIYIIWYYHSKYVDYEFDMNITEYYNLLLGNGICNYI